MSNTAPSQHDGARAKSPADSPQTVEALVRGQLSRALGGKRGMLEGAVPTLGFTITWIGTHDLRLALGVSGSLAVVLLVVRLVQRSTIQFVLNAMVGIAIAAVFALRSGRAEDAFLPGLIYNAVYAVVLAGSVLVRWPLVGLMLGGVTGDLTGWQRDARLRSLCSRLTWLLALPCVLRVIVQYPLWSSGHAGWLGIAKIGMGWPLQIAALAAMAWVLNRDDTTVTPSTS
ncbi:MAG: DUF3159 domain-containing protein [Propionibacteriales bacterium]|nr:DUF3159 domain-containing protein [Propionibacteriales bacterium]